MDRFLIKSRILGKRVKGWSQKTYRVLTTEEMTSTEEVMTTEERVLKERVLTTKEMTSTEEVMTTKETRMQCLK